MVDNMDTGNTGDFTGTVLESFIDDEAKRMAAPGGDESKKTPEEIAAEQLELDEAEKARLLAESSSTGEKTEKPATKDTDKPLTSEDVLALSDEDKKGIIEEYDASAMDERGNIIDKDGNIVVAAADLLEVLNEEDAPEPLTVQAAKLAGVDLKDTEGKPLEFEDTPEGIINLSKELANTYVESIEEARIKKYPQLQEVYEHIALHGNLDGYNKEDNRSYSNLKVDADTSKETYVNLIVDKYMVLHNMSKEQATRFATMSADEETWEKDGKEALSALVKAEGDAKAARTQEVAARKEAQEKSNKDYWDGVNTIISKGTLDKGIKIADSDKDAFFKYLAVPVDGRGLSQSMIDAGEEKLDTSLIYSYLRFKNIDFKSLIQAEMQTGKVNSLRNKIRASIKANNKGSTNVKPKKSGHSTADDFPSVDQF